MQRVNHRQREHDGAKFISRLAAPLRGRIIIVRGTTNTAANRAQRSGHEHGGRKRISTLMASCQCGHPAGRQYYATMFLTDVNTHVALMSSDVCVALSVSLSVSLCLLRNALGSECAKCANVQCVVGSCESERLLIALGLACAR